MSKIHPLLLLVCLCLAAASPAPGQTLAFEATETEIDPAANGALVMGDLDNDGWLDVVITGQDAAGPAFTRVYRNGGQPGENGRWLFTPVEASLPGSQFSTLALGDYDGDGDLDLLLVGSGEQESSPSGVYRNDGAFHFTNVLSLPGIKLTGNVKLINSPAAAWADLDNDGDLDAVVSGTATEGGTLGPTLVYENLGDDVFQLRSGLELPVLANGSIDVGDFDRDGDVDLLVTSHPIAGSRTTILRNDGGFNFADIAPALPPVDTGVAFWGDYDNDGDLDVLVAGQGQSAGTPGVYRNNGGGNFELAAPLPASLYGTWADLNADGHRDVLLVREPENTGSTSPAPARIELYTNTGSDHSLLLETLSLEGVNSGGAITTADFSGDGVLDLLVTGILPDPQGNLTDLRFFAFRNATRPEGNLPPVPPDVESLKAHFDGNDLVLEWDPGSDPDGPTAALTYNVQIGTISGAHDVLPSMSILFTGARLLPRPGNAGHRTSLRIRDLDPSLRYHWYVQTVDASFVGSGFVDQNFKVATERSDAPPSQYVLLGNYPNPFRTQTTISYTLPEPVPVRLTVFDPLGRQIAVLVDAVQAAGLHETLWNGRSDDGSPLPSGLYYYRLETPNRQLSGTLTLLR